MPVRATQCERSPLLVLPRTGSLWPHNLAPSCAELLIVLLPGSVLILANHFYFHADANYLNDAFDSQSCKPNSSCAAICAVRAGSQPAEPD